MTTLKFSGASDDTMCLDVDGHRAEDEHSQFQGYLVERGEGPPFQVRAYLTPAGHWVFSVGFPPDTDPEAGADIGMLDMQVRQHPDRKYSTELIIRFAGDCIVTPIEWETHP